MTQKIFISVDILKENDVEYFLSHTKKFFFKSIKKLIKLKKNVKITVYFTIKKEFKNFLLKEINNFNDLKINIKINLNKNNLKDNYSVSLKYYKKNKYNIFLKLSGETVIDEDFIIRTVEYINKGYGSIYSNLIEVYEDDFTEYFKNKKFNNINNEKFLFNFLNKNTHLYSFKNVNLIKKKNFFILESNSLRLLAFCNNDHNKSIFIENFQNLGQIVLKSHLDENFRTRYAITSKIVSEIDKNILPKINKNEYRYRLIIRKKPNKKIVNNSVEVNNPNKIFKINSENIIKNFVSTTDLEVDFMYYKSLYIYHVYNVYKKKFKIPLSFILLLSFIPFTIRKFIYYAIIKKIYSKSDPFYNHTIDRILFHQSKNNLIFFLNKYLKK